MVLTINVSNTFFCELSQCLNRINPLSKYTYICQSNFNKINITNPEDTLSTHILCQLNLFLFFKISDVKCIIEDQLMFL